MTTNPLPLRRPTLATLLRGSGSVASLALLLGSAAGTGLFVASHPELYRGALAIALVVNLVVAGMKWPRAAALATLLFLVLLAFIRRVLIADAGFTSNDPLLLVGPVVALFLLYRLYIVEGRRNHDRLFKLMVALLAVAVLQVFNPYAIGGLLAAAGGLLFVGVPMLWFFVGRELCDRRSVTVMIYGTIGVACLVAVYGLLQTRFGSVPSWDRAWVQANGYGSLFVGDRVTSNLRRPFGTFSSNQEFAAFMSIAVTFVAALVLRRRYVAALALPLLVLALFLAGGRGYMVTTALAGVILLALLTRQRLAGALVVIVGVLGAYGAASTFGPRIDRAAGLTGDAIVERNVSGILNPLDPNKSTVILHWENIVRGFADGITHPAGRGTGATSIATTLTDSENVDTENDIANSFVNLGLVGGLLYVAVIFLVFRGVLGRYFRDADVLSFAVAGLLVVTFGQWLNGGLYAVAPMFWFLAGWATRPEPVFAVNPAVAAPAAARARARRP
jgi:hypothetical protein